MARGRSTRDARPQLYVVPQHGAPCAPERDSTRIVVADADAEMRATLRRVLEAAGDFAVHAEAQDAPAAIRAALHVRPQLAVVAVDLPAGGISAAREIASRLPECKIVMLAGASDEDELLPALVAGASGYLGRDVNPERLPYALRDVLDGGAAIPRTLVARMVEELRDRSPRRRAILLHGAPAELTSREWEVLDLMRAGLGTGEIAQKLFVSSATVRSHVSAVVRKLGASSRGEVVRLFRAG